MVLVGNCTWDLGTLGVFSRVCTKTVTSSVFVAYTLLLGVEVDSEAYVQ